MEIKVPFYNVLNMFLTGLIFMSGCTIIYPDLAASFLKSDVILNLQTYPEIILTVCALSVAYEVGLIINRIGSVVVEPVLKKLKAIPFDDNYVKYNTKKKEFPIMNTLSREFALSRTGIVLFGILTAAAIYGKNIFFIRVYAATTFVYFLSYRKHAGKIVALMKDTGEEKTVEILVAVKE